MRKKRDQGWLQAWEPARVEGWSCRRPLTLGRLWREQGFCLETECGFEKVKSEVSMRFPRGDAEWAVGCVGLAFGGTASLETINLEVMHTEMVLPVKCRWRREEFRGRTESWDTTLFRGAEIGTGDKAKGPTCLGCAFEGDQILPPPNLPL